MRVCMCVSVCVCVYQGRIQRGLAKGPWSPPNRGIETLHHLFNHARASTHSRAQTYTSTYTLCVCECACARACESVCMRE